MIEHPKQAQSTIMTRASRCLLCTGAIAAWSQLLSPAVGLDNGVGRTPPLGWASWNTFVDVALNESVIRETAEAMVAHGLDKVGSATSMWTVAGPTSIGRRLARSKRIRCASPAA